MRVTIRSLLRGAREARGDVVLIDVFTSTTLIVTLLEHGATSVLPELSARQARALGASRPGSILMGERWGKKLRGFQYNTSAVRGSELDVDSRQVVLSTTNGTLGILSAKHAERLVLACFRNLSAVAEELATSNEVTLVPIGLAHGTIQAIEDELCAEAIKRRLLGESTDYAEIEHQIRRDLSSRVRNIGRREDVDFCLQLDQSDVVPELREGVIVASSPSRSSSAS